MEFLIELVLELALEGGVELSKSKKIPKIIRYLVIILIVLFFAVIIIGLFLIGVTILKNNIIVGLFMIAISVIFLFLAMIKFKKIYLEKVETKEITK